MAKPRVELDSGLGSYFADVEYQHVFTCCIPCSSGHGGISSQRLAPSSNSSTLLMVVHRSSNDILKGGIKIIR